MTSHDPPTTPDSKDACPASLESLRQLLHGQTFVVLTHNSSNGAGDAYEAWAYRGPLDFDSAAPIRFGLGPDPAGAIGALDGQLAEENSAADMPSRKPAQSEAVFLRVDRRELATILGALRFHQDENLHGGGEIADKVVGDIATDGGTLEALDFAEVDRLCQRLNLDTKAIGLSIEPPDRESGEEPLFRVVYVIDVNAADAREAASSAHRIMADPQSRPPVLRVIDHSGAAVTVDLSDS